MMQRWGHHEVSSALEVARILQANPPKRGVLDAEVLQPPTWGGPDAGSLAMQLAATGAEVWSWDDHGVAYSTPDAATVVHYRTWHMLFYAHELLEQQAEPDSSPCPFPPRAPHESPR
jgi:hypothetical protein